MTYNAKLPGIPKPVFSDPALQAWAQAVTEHLEVRAGHRGDKQERAVTLRELTQMGAVAPTNHVGPYSTQGRPNVNPNAFAVPVSGGYAVFDIDRLADSIRNTKLFRDLSASIDDPKRFDSLAAELRGELLRSIAAEAHARGTEISKTNVMVQEASRAVAAQLTELTAKTNDNAAGLREVQFAQTTETGAIAGQVTQLEARMLIPISTADLLPVPPASPYASLAALESAVPAASADTRKYYRVADGSDEVLYRSDGTAYALVGTEGAAKLEQVMLVTADKSEGLEAQYTLKVNAGRAVAGFGIAATERDGVPDSAFIVQANKFALTFPYDYSQESTPSATAAGETWYKPSTEESYYADAAGTDDWVLFTPLIPFAVDTTTGEVAISGSLRVADASGPLLATVGTTTTNFNNRNDRDGSAIVAPTIASDGTAIDHTLNTDGSVNLSFEWDWSGDEEDIDGFIITVYTSTSSSPYTFGTTPSAERTFTVLPNKRSLIGYGYPANIYYTLGVQAYRTVDPDVDSSGVIKSTIAVSAASGENPYRPSSNVAFAGDITGTVNGTAAATVVSNASLGATAYSQVNDGTTGLAAKMGAAQKNTLSGQGGIRVGSIDWDSAGNITSGYGVALTAKGIVGRNSGGTTTFVLSAVDGSATFSGDINTAGQVYISGNTTTGGYNAALTVTGANSGSKTGIYVTSSSGASDIGVNAAIIGGGTSILAQNTSGTAIRCVATSGTALSVSGKIVKSRTTGHYIRVYAPGGAEIAGSPFEYAFE